MYYVDLITFSDACVLFHVLWLGWPKHVLPSSGDQVERPSGCRHKSPRTSESRLEEKKKTIFVNVIWIYHTISQP